MRLKLLCSLRLHSWQTRIFGTESSPFLVRHCTRMCGKKPEYMSDGNWTEFEIPERKYQPMITPERMRGA